MRRFVLVVALVLGILFDYEDEKEDEEDLQIAAMRFAVILSFGCRGKPAGKKTPHE